MSSLAGKLRLRNFPGKFKMDCAFALALAGASLILAAHRQPAASASHTWRGSTANPHTPQEGHYDSLAAAIQAIKYKMQLVPAHAGEVGYAPAHLPTAFDLTFNQQVYVKASNTGALDEFGSSVAVSGNTAVVGAQFEDSNATGVNGNQSNNSATDAGAAYVFVRNGMTWSQQAYLKASNTGAGDNFGLSVAISGNTIAVGAWREDSNATGVNGDQNNNSTQDSGAVYVFVRDGTTWSQQAYLKASNTGFEDAFGNSVALAGDTIVVGAPNESSNATGVNGDQNNDAALAAGAGYVFVRNGTAWSQQAYLKAANTQGSDLFGGSVALSGDTLVIGAQGEDSNATGVNGDQNNNAATDAGAAYVFARNGTAWSQQAYLKASNTGTLDQFGSNFNRQVAISGDTIVVGALFEDSNATGVNGDQNNNAAPDSGAAYVFVRSGTTWGQQAYLKAFNTGAGDLFGASVALSGDTLVIGAPLEDSNATGINGDQNNNLTLNAGAAYSFNRVGGQWSQDEYLKPTFSRNNLAFGYSAGLGNDTLTLGMVGDQSTALGIGGDPSLTGANHSGGANFLSRPPANTAPELVALAPVVERGSDNAFQLIALVGDDEQPAATLNITVNDGTIATVNGVTISNIEAVGSGVRANVSVSCEATTAMFTLKVTDNGGLMDTGTLTVTVNPNTSPTLTYSTNPTPASLNGSATINPTSGPSDSGTINSIFVQDRGTYTGTVNVNNTTGAVSLNNAAPLGSHTITIRATDNCNSSTDAPFTLNVTCPVVTVNPTSPDLPPGTVGTFYTNTFTAAGGTGPYTFTISAGTQPPGLSLTSAGVLSGTPTLLGTSNFTIKATDANGCMGTRAYTLTIGPPCGTITINPSGLPNGFVGTAYNQTLSAMGGNEPYTFTHSVGVLPGGLALAPSGVLFGTADAAGTFSFTIKATDANGCMSTQAYTVVISGPGYLHHSLPNQIRALDTRLSSSGCITPHAPINANSTFTLNLTSACTGIPANAAAVTGNLTVVPGATGGYVTVYPDGVTQPTVANSNFKPFEITNNFITTALGANGNVKIYSSATTEVVFDLTGYFAPPASGNAPAQMGGLYFHPLPTPVRLVETRQVFNGCFKPPRLLGTGNPNADPALDLLVQGRNPGLPAPCNSIPADAEMLVGNATTVFPTGGGYLTLYPNGAPRPLAASSNYAGGDIINGPFAVRLGTDGMFKVYTLATTDLVIDVTGYYSANATDANGQGLLFNPLSKPMRLLETRLDFPNFPLVGCYRPNAPLPAQPNIHTQPVWGPCADQPPLSIPTTARALVGNATVVNPVAGGFLTFYPGNVATAPTIATSNYSFPVIFGYNRHFLVGLSPADGTFKILTQSTTHLVVDVSGYFAP